MMCVLGVLTVLLIVLQLILYYVFWKKQVLFLLSLQNDDKKVFNSFIDEIEIPVNKLRVLPS